MNMFFVTEVEVRLIIFFTAGGLQKQNLKLTVAQTISFSLQNSGLNKVGKTTLSFMYDPSQIPYGFTVEVMNSSRDEIW